MTATNSLKSSSATSWRYSGVAGAAGAPGAGEAAVAVKRESSSHDAVARRASVEECFEVVECPHAHGHARLVGRAAEVRQQDDLLHGQEIGRHLRLLLVHVQRRAGNLLAVERGDQRGFVHDVAARRVDKK